MKLRATHPNHVWSYNLVFIGDAYSCMIRILAVIYNGIPENIRCDNDPEFIAKELRSRLSGIGVKIPYIEPESPWENDFC